MNLLQVFWDAVKESVLLNYGNLVRFKSSFQQWINGIVSYGVSGTEELRGKALMFNLSRREFADALNAVIADQGASRGMTSARAEVDICPRCTHLEWRTYMKNVLNGHDHSPTDIGLHVSKVCSRCVANYYVHCTHCGYLREAAFDGERFMTNIRNYGTICRDCLRRSPESFAQCVSCHAYHAPSNQTIHRYDRISERPVRYAHNDDNGAYWVCHNCWTPESSRCKPRHLEFNFPALNLGPDSTIAQDEIVEIAHGGGDIASTALQEIHNLIFNKTRGNGDYGIQLRELIQPAFNFDSRWMTKDGNFPKRVAKLLITQHNLKLTEELMSEIGNIAQRYTSKPGSYRLSITRDLNKPKHEFVHGDSCWWSSYWWSRCNLKSLGGFGLRTWETDANGNEKPNGRAWMMPLKVNTPGGTNARNYGILQAAPEMLPADAYIIFNGYGPRNTRLDSLEFGRMVASMTGKSYRKIDFSISHHLMYVNGTNIGADSTGKGILVAEQSICDQIGAFALNRIPDRCSCPGKPA